MAAIAASSVLVFVVWGGLHANRAEAKAGQPPWWAIISGLVLVGLVLALYRWGDANEFLAAFSSCLIGTFLGGGWTYILLRWASRAWRR